MNVSEKKHGDEYIRYPLVSNVVFFFDRKSYRNLQRIVLYIHLNTYLKEEKREKELIYILEG